VAHDASGVATNDENVGADQNRSLTVAAPIDVTATPISRDREGAITGRAAIFEEGSALCIRAGLGFRGGVKADKLSPAGSVKQESAPVRPIFVEVQ
jgi:hypothetical protein